MGCGSGILSFFAAQAGARKIYAVEASTMAQHAEVSRAGAPKELPKSSQRSRGSVPEPDPPRVTLSQVLVKSNNLTERIVVIPGKVEEVSLPEQVDIIISEPMGYMLFNERMLESYLHAKKYLKPSGECRGVPGSRRSPPPPVPGSKLPARPFPQGICSPPSGTCTWRPSRTSSSTWSSSPRPTSGEGTARSHSPFPVPVPVPRSQSLPWGERFRSGSGT